jgi:hypothetical protein
MVLAATGNRRRRGYRAISATGVIGKRIGEPRHSTRQYLGRPKRFSMRFDRMRF